MNREVHEWRDDTVRKRFWRVRMLRTFTSPLVEFYGTTVRRRHCNSTAPSKAVQLQLDTLHCLTCNDHGLFWLCTLLSLSLMPLCNLIPTFWAMHCTGMTTTSHLYPGCSICLFTYSNLLALAFNWTQVFSRDKPFFNSAAYIEDVSHDGVSGYG